MPTRPAGAGPASGSRNVGAAMLILLPPSEGKAAPSGGPPVALEELAFAAELTESRLKLLGALERLAAVPLRASGARCSASPPARPLRSR